jgi:hypothetical protein
MESKASVPTTEGTKRFIEFFSVVPGKSTSVIPRAKKSVG